MISNVWAYVALLLTGLIASVSGWVMTWRLSNKLRQAQSNNVLIEVDKMRAEAELKESTRKEQIEKETRQKIDKIESGIQNAINSDPVADLNNAIKNK